MNYAGNIDMYFSPYKGRSVELGDIVDVYRNLNIENGYSIRSAKTGLVLAHATTVTLKNCKFHVSESGRQKTIEQKRKRVHAYVRGVLSGINQNLDHSFQRVIYYNPYVTPLFLEVETDAYIHEAEETHLEGKHCFVKEDVKGGEAQ